MNIQFSTLLEPTPVPAAATAIYTNNSGQNALLQKVTFTDNDTLAHTLTVWWVPSGGANGAANMVVNNVTISPKGPTNDGVYEAIVLEGHMLQPGDALWAIADDAAAVIAAITGSLIS